MKKFLFTLAALLMAGSLFARDYLYIDNFEVKKDELGTTKVIPVKAHFDRYVSAWEIWLTMPEGVTVTAWEEGENVFGLPYTNQNGKSRTLDASITTKDNAHFIAITSALQGDYIQNEEGAWISAGPVHWKPGVYDEMLLLTVSIDENFKGGVISVKSAPACGNDLRPEVQENKADGTVETEECTVTVEKPAAPQPTLTWNDVTYTMTASCEGHQVVLMINNEAVENPYTVAQTDKDQTIEFSAYTVANADESGNSETIKQTVTVPAKVVETIEKPTITFAGEETTTMTVTVECEDAEATLIVNGVEIESNVYTYTVERADLYTAGTVEVTAQAKKGDVLSEEAKESKAWVVQQKPVAPVPTLSWDPDTYTMTASCDGHQVVLMINNEAVSNPCTVAQTTEDQTIEFSAYTVANADESGNSETIKQTVTVPAKPLMELTGEITFSVTQGNINDPKAGIVTATYNGPETGVTVKIVGDPTKVAAATSEGVRLSDYGTYQVKAVATAEGYADLEDEGEVTWDEPQTDAPEFNVSQDGLTVEATGEGTVKLYIVNADGSETEIDNPTTFVQENEARTVNLKAVAHVDGAKDGVATTSIVIPAKSSEPGTGVNELVDGKAVKSVRYFNMAGQEMQEVNGVTIVVTTYTDGTTSAVKVMK